MNSRTALWIAKVTLVVIASLMLLALCRCNGAPGAAAPPGLSQLGKRKSETPGVDFQNVSKSKHICFFPNRGSAETNSQYGPLNSRIANDGNAIEYSELGEIHLLYNFHYVKYIVRCNTFFGCDDHMIRIGAPAETDTGSRYILYHNRNNSQLWMYSQNGKSQLRMISFQITATSRIVRTGTVNKS